MSREVAINIAVESRYTQVRKRALHVLKLYKIAMFLESYIEIYFLQGQNRFGITLLVDFHLARLPVLYSMGGSRRG